MDHVIFNVLHQMATSQIQTIVQHFTHVQVEFVLDAKFVPMDCFLIQIDKYAIIQAKSIVNINYRIVY